MKTVPSFPPHDLIDLYLRSGFNQGIKNDRQLSYFARQLKSTPEIVEQAILDLDGSGFLNGMGLRRLRSIYRRFRDSDADLDELVERPEWKQIGQELCWLCKMGFLDLEGIGESDAAINPALEGYPKQTFLGRVRYQIREV
jgi:hypothetical protein